MNNPIFTIYPHTLICEAHMSVSKKWHPQNIMANQNSFQPLENGWTVAVALVLSKLIIKSCGTGSWGSHGAA